MFKKYDGHIDWIIFIFAIALMLFSIAFVYSASATFAEDKFGDSSKLFWSHSIKIFIGVALLVLFSKIDYHIWQKYSKIFILGAIVPLILVFVFSPRNNVFRWINLGPFSFQPSELAKFAMVIHFATMLTERQIVIKTFKYGILPFLVWSGIICILIAIQPNFSTALVVYLIALSMMFIGNVNLIHLGSVGLVSLAGAGIFAISASYRMQRFLVFFGDSQVTDAMDKYKFQGMQAILAFGNGGIFGVGPGKSRQSLLFLPESYGDFIFSIIGEEYGYIGVLAILIAFIIIFWRGIIIIRNAPDNYGYFLAIGILITFAFYVFVSSGVNSGVLPTTGLPMPFISYGGTAVLIYASALGILLNISAQAKIFPKQKRNDENENISSTDNLQ